MSEHPAHGDAPRLSPSGVARKAALLPTLLGELERERRARRRRRLALRAGAACGALALGAWLAGVISTPERPQPTVAVDEEDPGPRPVGGETSRIERLDPTPVVTRLRPPRGSLIAHLDSPANRDAATDQRFGVTRLSDAELREASIAAGQDLGVVRTAHAVYVVPAGDG